jgi:cysteinyl-tRNA synthetase
MIKLYNTLTRQVEEFKPLKEGKVGMYTCGPTVYDYTHIGHSRKYIGDDILKKTLLANGFEVKHVMNVTDVGHLTSDADDGDDKLEKGAKEREMTVWDVAKFFEEYFFKAMDQVNVERPDIVSRATEHINEQIKLIERLEKNGFIYQTSEAIYFDVSKFTNYTVLSHQKLEEKEVGSRVEVRTDSQKKNPQDFSLWFFTVGHFENHTMRWSSPWGEGFPGWHIECSAMSMEYLGDTIDIHTGGIDHIMVHHTNEIAQSEAATGKKFVNFWVHHNFLNVNDEKMSKSKKNFLRVEDIIEMGFDPIAMRYAFLQTHYRDEVNFSQESLQAAQNALNNLREQVRDWPSVILKGSEEYILRFPQDDNNYYTQFLSALNNDLNTAQALAIMWNMFKSNLPENEKANQLLLMDKILGLKLDEYIGKKLEIPEGVQKLVDQREKVRAEKDFAKSDELRDEIKKLGYEVLDTPNGPKLQKA